MSKPIRRPINRIFSFVGKLLILRNRVPLHWYILSITVAWIVLLEQFGVLHLGLLDFLIVLLVCTLFFFMGIYFNSPQKNKVDLSGLTKREKEVAQLLLRGLSNKDIAENLFISLPTVKTHLSRIYKKLNVPNRNKAMLILTKQQVIL